MTNLREKIEKIFTELYYDWAGYDDVQSGQFNEAIKQRTDAILSAIREELPEEYAESPDKMWSNDMSYAWREGRKDCLSQLKQILGER